MNIDSSKLNKNINYINSNKVKPENQLQINPKKKNPNIDRLEITNHNITKIFTPQVEKAKQEIINSIKNNPEIQKYQTIKDHVSSGTYKINACLLYTSRCV